MNEFRQYETAIGAFRLEYNGIPGDFDEAEEYWGTRSAPDATDGTNNGNGNGIIAQAPLSTTPGEDREDLLVWQHLSLAGIVPGAFAGTPQAGLGWGQQRQPGVTVPKATGGTTGAYVFNNPGDSGLYLIHNITVDTTCAAGPIMTPKDARAVDTKLDDGEPGLGRVIAFNGFCNTAGGAYGARYECHSINPADYPSGINNLFGATPEQKQSAEYVLSNSSRECYLGYLLN